MVDFPILPIPLPIKLKFVAVEVMSRLKMESSDDNGRVGDEPGPGLYPERPGEPDCIYYLRTGTCGYGSNCRFNHPCNGGGQGQVYGVKNTSELPERAGKPDCGFFIKTGTCKYGSTCKYHHPKDKQADSLVLLNILGLPMRQDAKPCIYYMRTGACKYGHSCKFHHPQPQTTANVSPVPVYGSASSGAPSGSVSPLSVTSVLTPPASNGHLSVSYLPERPEQPECRYFMNNGSCKYGPDCKYHHPREKISQLASSSLGPLGLPLRPGQPLCSYYTFYGLCKYGPTCKFDHPLDGYSYAYSMSVPPLVTSYSPLTPYQRTPSIVLSSETSPSKSIKLNDWINKGDTTSNKNRHPNGKDLDFSNSLPRSSKASSEVLQNESD
ncbi:hypothetical protein RD792_006961 [Penstemon davidsonii]|uniref:C3H1-type domain-containing protein n=1 Tax=Penstemon davidsonii TaxID=160366 RepID=A0ABR0D5C1_9LAMI|nr:hypothetical protein RD792_006961 [Penstemon davidsonii]